MQTYFIEGVYIPKAKLKRVQKKGQPAPADLEPFAQTFWANSQAEALAQAEEAIAGGQWTQGPTVKRKSEEERMRLKGEAELPLFDGKPAARKKCK